MRTSISTTSGLALGLALMFALSPATRFGYLAYPLGLLVWIALARPDMRGRRTRIEPD
jgi:hypothetical protein